MSCIRNDRRCAIDLESECSSRSSTCGWYSSVSVRVGVKTRKKREENIDRVNIDFIKKTLQNWPFLAGK